MTSIFTGLYPAEHGVNHAQARLAPEMMTLVSKLREELFPLLLDKYGLVKAILWISLLPVAMVLAYLRGYWVSTLFTKKSKSTKE